jgi:hypothetical protein
MELLLHAVQVDRNSEQITPANSRRAGQLTVY